MDGTLRMDAESLRQIRWQLSKKDIRGFTPLLRSIKAGDFDSVKFLIELGSPIDETNEEGQTALHLASLLGHVEEVRILLEKGASPRIEDVKGRTPWHHAAVNGHTSILDLLSQRLRKPRVDEDGNTSLHRAALKGQLNNVEYLLHNGIPVNERNRKGETAVYLATKGGHVNVVKLLRQTGGDVRIEAVDRSLPLHVAAGSGNLEVMKAVLGMERFETAQNSESDGNETGPSLGEGPSTSGHQSEVRSSERRQSQDPRSGSSRSPVSLERAESGSRVRRRRSEPRDGAAENMANPEESTTASREDIYSSAETLYSTYSEPEPEPDDEFCNTPFGSYHFMNLVLMANVDEETHHQDEAKRHLIKTAIDSMTITEEDFEKTNKNGMTLLHIAAGVGSEVAVDSVLRLKPDMVHSRAAHGFTAFSMAAAGGSVQIMEKLFRAGSDPGDAENTMSLSPLHLSAFRRNLEATIFLIAHRVDLNAQDMVGATPLHYAVTRLQNAVVIRTLIEAGADVTIRNNNGALPIELIAEQRYQELFDDYLP